MVHFRFHRAATLFIATLSFGSSVAAGQPEVTVTVNIDPSHPIATIADDFLGLGYETSAVAQPNFFTGTNARMIALYRNLTPHGLIRIGGNVSDHTRYEPDGTPAAKTEREVTVVNRANLNDLGDFARATGWRVMWGLNLGTGTKAEAVEEAVAVDRALGPTLHSFEIGNEVDLMRKYAKNYDAYHATFAGFKAAIRSSLPRAAFSGPDSASDVAFVERFATAESADMKLATFHYYRGGARDAKSTIERLLTTDAAFDAQLERLRTACAAAHVGYRINEVNSFFGGGKENVSDTFASALWALDYTFDLAAHGCGGLNLQTDVNKLGFISFYSPIVHDETGNPSARPEYYGLLAFAMAGHGDVVATTVDRAEVNVTAHATRDGHDALYLTVINKDLRRDAAVECYCRKVGRPPRVTAFAPRRSRPRATSPSPAQPSTTPATGHPGPRKTSPSLAALPTSRSRAPARWSCASTVSQHCSHNRQCIVFAPSPGTPGEGWGGGCFDRATRPPP